MVLGAMPFKSQNIDGLHKKILERNCELEDSEASENVLDLIKKMLTIDPDQRITLEQIVEHPWMSDNDMQQTFYKKTNDVIANPEEFVLQKLIHCGYPKDFILQSIHKQKLNHSFACYMSLAKDFE